MALVIIENSYNILALDVSLLLNLISWKERTKTSTDVCRKYTIWFLFLFVLLTHSFSGLPHRLKTSSHGYKMRKQAVLPSGLSKASSPRSPVWYQVSIGVRRCVYMPVYCMWLHIYICCGSLCMSSLIRACLTWCADNCVCVCVCVFYCLTQQFDLEKMHKSDSV